MTLPVLLDRWVFAHRREIEHEARRRRMSMDKFVGLMLSSALYAFQSESDDEAYTTRDDEEPAEEPVEVNTVSSVQE